MHKNYFLKGSIFLSIVSILFSVGKVAGQINPSGKHSMPPVNNYNLKWQTNPLDHRMFIQNKGQFDNDIPGNNKILYQALLGDVKAYFTSAGVIYKNEKDKKYQTVIWENARPDAQIEAEQQQSNDYIYPAGVNGVLHAQVCKKIVYRNIYPNIDIEYTFPEDKDGIKYTLILHPGADISLARLKYENVANAYINDHGDAIVNTEIGDFTDHAPVSYYQNGGKLKTAYSLNGNEESFTINGAYNKAATVIIDPWTTNPFFTSTYNKAYDLDYDYSGNVYVYGGYNPFQLVKMNSAGKILWTFNASSIDGVTYGDFAVDKTTGTSYIIEGAHATGARALKVNTLGNLIATFPGTNNMNEMWRVVYDECNRRMVIGAGGTSSNFQACTLDTNMTTLNVVNVLGATAAGHSMVFTAIDPSGATCYMATAKSAVVDTANFNNVLVKLPLPALTPTTYTTPDSYKFVELASISYVGPGVTAANAMNGMAASPNWLYMSDGRTLEQVNKNTGAIVHSINISSTPFAWGGLDADLCDNVYAGNQSAINIYSPSLGLTKTISLPGNVYDVVLGMNQQTLYACGKAFVSAYNVSSSVSVNTTVVATHCGCNGSAKATLSACGSIDTAGVSYKWSNGQTTQTATNLCAGTYTVSILVGCSIIYFDTVTVSSQFITVNAPSPSICSGSSVSLAASGGTTYSWKPATGLSATTGATVTANPAVTTTYTLTGTTGTCNDSITIVVTVNPVPNVSVTGPPSIVCPNSSDTLKASGATSYAWLPAGSVTCSSCSNTVANISSTTTFTLIGTSSGCNDTTHITVKVFPVPTIKITVTPTACDTFNGTASATVSGTGPYTYMWTPTGGTTTSVTGLSAGTYVISVKDTNGCITSKSCTIKIAASPTVTATNNVASCDSANGKAIATVVGGTSPYKYLWSPGGGTSSTDQNLKAGIYTVVVTDINGCTGKASTILEDTGATVNFSARNNVSCWGKSDGGATVQMTGGTNPISYLWSPSGSTTQSVNNLTVGQFTVTVSDARHCVLIDTLNIHQPNKLVATIGPANVSNVSCFGGNNGKMSVNPPTGGTAPYTYSWNTIPPQTTDTATGLMPVNYTVTITDKNGCTATAHDSVGEPAKLVANASNSSATCGNNGIATSIAIGGTPGYSYNWGVYGNGQSIYNLGKGTYTVTVTDAHGCTAKDSTTVDTIGQTAAIKNGSNKNVTCNAGSDGGATVSVIGGDTSLYGYAWAPSGGTNATATNLSPGVYTITVTYLANLCSVKVYDTVTQPPPLNSTIKYNAKCGNMATAYDTAWGGTPPYSYLWNTTPVQTTAIANLTSGNYTLTVKDSNGCSANFNVMVPNTDPVANFIPTPDTIVPGDSIEFINLSTGANTWYWTFGDGSSSIDSLPYHVYTLGGSFVVSLKATSSYGCSDSATVTIFIKEGITVPNVFTPNGDGINDVFHVNSYGLSNYRIDIYDRWGLLIFEGTGPNNDWTGRTMSGELVSAGTYYYIITVSDNNGKSFNQKGYLELIR